MSNLLEIEKLNVSYRTEGGLVPVLHEVGLTIAPGECVGLIGESGSGKTTLSDAVLRILPYKNGQGRNITYIPQDPNTSLDPLSPLVRNFEEILATNPRSRISVHSDRRTVKILEKMGHMTHGIDLQSFPHQLSGGMRQRVLIGLALQPVPDLIIADEPTSNLDVTLERKILEIFEELKKHFGLSFLLTTHNLALARYFCDRIYVLYQGRIVESGTTEEVFSFPKDAYTATLIDGMM
jgi:ABC-type dipeptide/oligopeptide/nickel transport system ATPase component